MGTRLRERSSRREIPSTRSSWALQPVSRILGQRPLEFVRRKAWTSKPVRLANGISAVTSLCLCDEACTGGPSLLISGDEDGGVSVLKVEGRDEESSSFGRLATPGLRRFRLHSSCVNTIKVLPDQRGFVCAGDDGALTAVASFEASSAAEIRRAALHLTGHSGFVTDCDVARTGHGVLSSSTDGKILLWDPVSSNTPVASVLVGRPVNSACFSAGDPYAIVCAPELGEARSSRGGGSSSGGSNGGKNDLVQIWDLRFLRSFKDSIPAALAAAFGEESHASTPKPASMQPPPPQSPQVWPSSIWSGSAGSTTTSRSSAARTPGEVPSWLTTVLGSTSAASPATPLLRRPAWTNDNSDADSSEKGWHRERGSLWSCGTPCTPGSIGKENVFPSSSSTCSCSPASVSRGGDEYAMTPSSSVSQQGPSRPARRVAAPVRDGPAATLCLASLPACGCLHQGKGKTWVPGGLKTWQASSRRVRTAEARERASVTCASCGSTPEAASAFSVKVSEDGRLIMVASRDRTVTLFDAQSREVVYRFGHPKLSTRARPILVEGDNGGGGRGDVFCGMTEGEVRCWKVGSQFPNRVFKPAGHHEGFEVCCLATSTSGATFASADSSGTVCVQSASSGLRTHYGSKDGDKYT